MIARMKTQFLVLGLALGLCACPALAKEVVITTGSNAAKNVQLAVDYLKARGETRAAAVITNKLSTGKLYLSLKKDADYTGYTQNREIHIHFSMMNYKSARRPPAVVVFDTKRQHGGIISLARTLYHESLHARGTMAEPPVWNRTIRLLAAWVERDLKAYDSVSSYAERTRLEEAGKIKTLVVNLKGYLGDFKDGGYDRKRNRLLWTEMDRALGKVIGKLDKDSAMLAAALTNEGITRTAAPLRRASSSANRRVQKTAKLLADAQAKAAAVRKALPQLSGKVSVLAARRKALQSTIRGRKTTQADRLEAAKEYGRVHRRWRNHSAALANQRQQLGNLQTTIRTLNTRLPGEKRRATALEKRYQAFRIGLYQAAVNGAGFKEKELPADLELVNGVVRQAAAPKKRARIRRQDFGPDLKSLRRLNKVMSAKLKIPETSMQDRPREWFADANGWRFHLFTELRDGALSGFLEPIANTNALTFVSGGVNGEWVTFERTSISGEGDSQFYFGEITNTGAGPAMTGILRHGSNWYSWCAVTLEDSPDEAALEGCQLRCDREKPELQCSATQPR